MKYRGEVEFNYLSKKYAIIHHKGQIIISEKYNEETEKHFNTADEVLEYVIDGKKLREIITQVDVTFRAI